LGDGVDWLEFSVSTDSEAVEAVVELFNRYGRGGAVIETPVDCFEFELSPDYRPASVVVKTYLPLDGSTQEPRRRIEEGLWHLGRIYPLPDPVIRELAEDDWANAWKRQYHRLRVGQRIVIVPSWEAYEPEVGQVVVRLEPGMAFGTGLHPSTRLCLQALESYLAPGCTVLDVGTGSGILAIAAAKLGARSVLAIDTDPVAVTVARQNVADNSVSQQVAVRRGSLLGGPSQAWMPRHDSHENGGSPTYLVQQGEYDLVLVNILAPVIMGMAPGLAARTGPGGRIIASGIIDSQEEDVVRALQGHGLEVVERGRDTDWVSLVAQHTGRKARQEQSPARVERG
jgi:ribosomal protein L11 methyltransferase